MPKIILQHERGSKESWFVFLLLFLFATSALGIVVMRGRGFTTAAAPVDDYTRLLWEFANTNNPTDDDSYVGTNTGTLGAGAAEPTWVAATGSVSAYYDFDNGDYITNCTPSALSAQRATLALWVKSDADTALSAWGVSISEATLQTYISLGYRYKNGEDDIKCYFVIDGNGKATLTTDGTLATDYLYQWHHIAVTLDSTNAILFVDGISNKVASCTNSLDDLFTASTPATRLDVGGIQGIANYWDGGVDNTRIYNTALSASDMSTLFWRTATNHGWSKWDYDNRSDWSNTVYVGTFSYDYPADTSADGANHGTKAAGAAAPTHATTAVPNGYYSFDGGDYITLPDPVVTQVFTLATWIYADSSGSGSRAILGGSTNGIGAPSTTGNIEVRMGLAADSDDKLRLIKQNTAVVHTSTHSIPQDTWIHIACTYDASNVATFYTNGVADGVVTSAQTFVSADNWIGASDNGEYWDGYLDEFRLYGSALSGAEIADIYNDTKWLFGL